ncbi:MAG TPA: hypothetical protein VLT88_05200 [Desulfosarcina sp.]|nr:hypothetical protein [Desulfosarcina sp.]
MRKNRWVFGMMALALVLGFTAAGPAIAAEETISGTVEQNDSGMIIIAADDGEDYLVKGQDLSEMVGKSVKVTGTLAEEADAKSITVMNLEEIKE